MPSRIMVEYLDPEDIIDRASEMLSHSERTVHHTKKLFDTLSDAEITEDDCLRIGAAMRISSNLHGEPVRVRPLAEILGVRVYDLIEIYKEAEKVLNVQTRADEVEYVQFLCKRLNVPEDKQQRAVDICNMILTHEDFQGTAPANIGCYAVAAMLLESDVKDDPLDKIMEMTSVSTATIQNNIEKMREVGVVGE